jgi:hypothetical protein
MQTRLSAALRIMIALGAWAQPASFNLLKQVKDPRAPNKLSQKKKRLRARQSLGQGYNPKRSLG